MTPIRVTTQQLAFGYDKVLARGIDLALEPGELVFLLGPNGAGKTTMLRTLSGLHRPTLGAVMFQGESIERWSLQDLARKRSIVLTRHPTLASISVREVVALGRIPHARWLGRLSREDHDRVDEAMNAVDAHSIADRAVNQLSDGQRQRVFLARAIAQETPILFLDEPTAYVDLPGRTKIVRLLHHLARAEKRTILLTTHDLDLAFMMADRVLLLNVDGRLEAGLPEELVLNGGWERTFAKEGLRFEPTTGRLTVPHDTGPPIAVVGSGLRAEWTCRALGRLGYRLSDECARKVMVTLDGWRLEGDGSSKRYGSLAELTQALKGPADHFDRTERE